MKSKTDNVSMSDVAERREYEIAAEVASLIPKFARNYLGINNLEIIAAIQVVGAQTADLRAQTADLHAQILAQMNRIEDKLFNSTDPDHKPHFSQIISV